MSQENLGKLADAAYQDGHHEQAYDHYVKILEDDPENTTALLRKGICAGWLSEPDTPRFEEMHVCIDKAREKGGEIDEEELSEQVMEMSEDFLAALYGEIDNTIEESEQEAVATGELSPMKQYGAQAEVFSEAGDRISQWTTVFEQIKFACDTAPDPERCGKAIREIDALVRHSSENMNYLTEHEDAGGAYQRLMKMRENLLETAKNLDPNFTPDTVVQSRGRQSKCFVVTATYGHRHHPTVARFRRFRDQVLLEYSLGRALVSVYYVVGPYAALGIERSRLLQKATRWALVEPVSKIISWIRSRL